jgi:hypothetical protein
VIDRPHWRVDNGGSFYAGSHLTDYLKSRGHRGRKSSVVDGLVAFEDTGSRTNHTAGPGLRLAGRSSRQRSAPFDSHPGNTQKDDPEWNRPFELVEVASL